MANAIDTLINDGSLPVNITVDVDNKTAFKLGLVILTAMVISFLIHAAILKHSK